MDPDGIKVLICCTDSSNLLTQPLKSCVIFAFFFTQAIINSNFHLLPVILVEFKHSIITADFHLSEYKPFAS